MKNTSAAYMACGVFLGLVIAKTSGVEPAWALFLIPAAVCGIAALAVDHS